MNNLTPERMSDERVPGETTRDRLRMLFSHIPPDAWKTTKSIAKQNVLTVHSVAAFLGAAWRRSEPGLSKRSEGTYVVWRYAEREQS